MRVFRLTQVGYATASSISGDNSMEYKVLANMRRHGNIRTDEQITDLLGGDRMTMRLVCNNLLREPARIMEIGSH